MTEFTGWEGTGMRDTSKEMGVFICLLTSLCLLASLCATAQAGASTRKIVVPNPQLIHCRTAGCSQLWKQDSDDGGVVYPAQVLTDFVNGEVVGLTAVYDKSVSAEELRAAIQNLYGDRPPTLQSAVGATWRIEAEQVVISTAEGIDGAKELIYLKFVPYSPGMKPGTYATLTPSAHIFDCPEKKPWWRIW
jgi:hypothetical protein